MKKSQVYFGMFISAVLGAVIASMVIYAGLPPFQGPSYSSIAERQQQVSYSANTDVAVSPAIDFASAANAAIPGVVHIRTLYSSGRYSMNPMNNIYRAPSRSSGSGVIVSDDGYIVTNNHVIEDARQIEVVLNDNRSYIAEIIGRDPTTDLALLKIEEQGLEFVKYGNSDNVVPGEWVLAIGNPFDLNSTVTAGIVSAKARNIGILRDRNNLQIESFIQTDAAVNPGNSGGALVNLKGELVGINTAIATPNGSYAGYSFAVPVALVSKVMDDLLEFGSVQRGLLGVGITDVDAYMAREWNLSTVSGVVITNVNENSAAETAGLDKGDVIVGINDKEVHNVSELQELVARNRPGDEIEVHFLRDGEEFATSATLKDYEGNLTVQPRRVDNLIEGAVFEELSDREREKFEIDAGVTITSVGNGPWKDAGIEAGLIVTRIDKLEVKDLETLNRILSNMNGPFLLEGLDEKGQLRIFGIDW